MADELFPGYRIEKITDDQDAISAYKVIGPKKSWFLMRNRHNPQLLFSVSESIGGSCKIRGWEWFREENGTIVPTKTMTVSR